MGRPRILDEKIMQKIADKRGKKNIRAINSMVSQKANKLGISPEAALVILAKEDGIGVATYQRKLDPSKQAEVREALPSIFTPRESSKAKKVAKSRSAVPSTSKKAQLRSAVEYLIHDEVLRKRCLAPLLGSSNFDVAINQATLVLEERIRGKAALKSRMVGENLVNAAFNEDIQKTVLQVGSSDPDDQRGLTQILRGIVPAFRNKTHHHIIDTFSREEAMRVCGFIDVLLRAVDESVKVK